MMTSLNPCYNGIYSLRFVVTLSIQKMGQGLNPCYNGIYSLRACKGKCYLCKCVYVLILVMMEYTL